MKLPGFDDPLNCCQAKLTGHNFVRRFKKQFRLKGQIVLNIYAHQRMNAFHL